MHLYRVLAVTVPIGCDVDVLPNSLYFLLVSYITVYFR